MSGGNIDLLLSVSVSSGTSSAVEANIPPFLGGSIGGSDVEAVRLPSSSFGAGLLVLDRSAAVPLARRSQEGLGLVVGLEAFSEDEAALSKDD